MRPPSERDTVRLMLTQLVDAFMTQDESRQRQAHDWLCRYVDRTMAARGWQRVGAVWRRRPYKARTRR